MSLIPYKARILVGAISLALKERKKFSQTIFMAPNKRKELIKDRAQQKNVLNKNIRDWALIYRVAAYSRSGA